MSELVQRDEIKVPVMDAWFAAPPDQRTDSFSFKFACKPTEPLLILQDGASFPVVAIRGEASAKVSTGKLELSPISFMKTNMLHGTAQMPGNPAGDPVQMVITQSAQPGIADVSMLFPPKNKKGCPEISKGRARFRKS
jgi:hypothetical protein